MFLQSDRGNHINAIPIRKLHFSLRGCGVQPISGETHLDALTTNHIRIIQSLTDSDGAWQSCIGQDYHTTTAKRWVGLSLPVWSTESTMFDLVISPCFLRSFHMSPRTFPTLPNYSLLFSTIPRVFVYSGYEYSTYAHWGCKSTPFRFHCSFLLSTFNIIVKSL